MNGTSKARVTQVLVGVAVLVVAVVTLRTVQSSGAALTGVPHPDEAVRNYQNRIHATEVMLETGRLEVSGS